MRTLNTISVSFLALALGGCNSVQPKPACKTQATEYVAKYFPLDDKSACNITAEVHHLMHYPADRTKPTDVPKIAIEPAAVFDAVDRRWQIDKPEVPTATSLNKYGTEFSLGPFTALTADDNDLCVAPKLSDTSVDVPEVPANAMAMPPTEAHPPVKLGYKWSNFKMLTRPDSNAVHWGADLERTDGAGCVAKFNVSGIWPVRPCGNGKDPMTGEPDPHLGEADDSLCKATDRHHDIHGDERELNNEFTYECDKVVKLCVPAKKFNVK